MSFSGIPGLGRLTAAVLVSSVMAAPVLAQSTTSLIDLFRGGQSSYWEIWSPTPTGGGGGGGGGGAGNVAVPQSATSVGADEDNSPPCIDENASTNCDERYFGFFAWALNEDASEVAGFVRFTDDDPGADREFQATIWRPGQSGVILLTDDGPALARSRYFIDGTDTTAQHFGSFAFDMAADAGVAVGTSWGLFRETSPAGQYEYLRPIQWTQDGGVWQMGFGLFDSTTGFPTTGDTTYGGATAVSPDGHHIAGFMGIVDKPSLTPENPQASYWDFNPMTELRLLGRLLPGESSIAKDVNDLGQVVGWSGDLPSVAFNTNTTLSSRIIQTLLAGPEFGYPLGPPGTGWQPRPFVWTEDLPAMRALSLVQGATTYTIGEARSIANNGLVATGWVANNLPFAQPVAAAWFDRGVVNAWDADQLVALPTVQPNATFRGESGIGVIGNISNAVDSSGRYFVGDVIYSSNEINQPHTQAVFWQLDENLNVVASGLVEEALTAIGVDMSGKELTLTRATGVVVEFDANGNPVMLFISGEGEGSLGSWFARMAIGPGGPGTPPPGMTTTASQLASLAAPAIGTREAVSALGYLAANQYCTRPEGQSVSDAPWCFFTVGAIGGYTDNGASGGGISGAFGLAHYFDEDLSVGASFGTQHVRGTVVGGSSYSAGIIEAGVYAQLDPETGLRARGSLAVGQLVDVTFTRIYANGAGTGTSTGTTSGWGVSLQGMLAYAVALDDNLRVVPYVEAEYSQVALAGWTDAGGPFNATIGPVTSTRTAITAGVMVEYDLDDRAELYGGVSLSALYEGGTGVGATIGPMALQVPIGGSSVIGTATAGARYELNDSTNVLGQVSVSTDFGGYAAAQFKVGFNSTF